MKNRIRATFTTNADTWSQVNNLLKEKGFPQNAMGILLTDFLETLALRLEHTDATSIRILLDK